MTDISDTLPCPPKNKSYLPQLSLLVGMNNPIRVLDEVKILFLDMFDQGDFVAISSAFEDITALFLGQLPGYKACDTPYHNLKHTTDVFLAMARLLHGAHVKGVALSENDVLLGLIAALMHDTGYIVKDTENYSSGATLAPLHIDRSIQFLKHALPPQSCPPESVLYCEQLIWCTDLLKPIDTISFQSPIHEQIGKILAAADLLAQTADRTYLEKLPLLYLEFKEAGTTPYNTEIELIQDAILFNEQVNERLTNQLDSVNRYLLDHFRIRWNIDADLYQTAIDRSMVYLSSVLDADSEKYKDHFRRVIKS